MPSLELTIPTLKEIISNKEVECTNCGSNSLGFREDKIRMRCDQCGRIREGHESIKDFIPNFRVLEKTSKTINKNLRVPLVLYKCEDITINSDMTAALSARESNVTVLGDVRGEKFFGVVSEDSRFMNPSNAIECRDSSVKVSGDVYDVYSSNSNLAIGGSVDFTLEARNGSEVVVKKDCKHVRVKGGSKVTIQGDVKQDVYIDENDESKLEVDGEILGERL